MALMLQSSRDSGIFRKKVASVKDCLAILHLKNPRYNPRRHRERRGHRRESGDFNGLTAHAVVAVVVVTPTDLLTLFLLRAAEMPPKKNRLNTTKYHYFPLNTSVAKKWRKV